MYTPEVIHGCYSEISTLEGDLKDLLKDFNDDDIWWTTEAMAASKGAQLKHWQFQSNVHESLCGH